RAIMTGAKRTYLTSGEEIGRNRTLGYLQLPSHALLFDGPSRALLHRAITAPRDHPQASNEPTPCPPCPCIAQPERPGAAARPAASAYEHYCSRGRRRSQCCSQQTTA